MRQLHKILIATLAIAISSLALHAQPANPVSWDFKCTQGEADTYDITMTATIRSGWHIYDLQHYEGGPNPTLFTFDLPEGVEKVGEVTASTESVKVMDEMFGMEIGYFEGVVTFTQTLKLTSAGAKAGVTVEWMACNDFNCIPPTDITESFTLGTPVVEEASAEDEASKSGTTNLWGLIIEALLWGFAALLTPCVFPMVPMTVSFFLKGSEDKKRGKVRAAMYGLFIVLLYTVPIAIIILATRIIGGEAVTADIFNFLATHWLPNIIFFVVFMVFAASFFGAFEITMPSNLVNGSDRKSESKGLGGVFFLALTLVLVSFSCTGPIVGTVLIKATAGEFWAPILAMLVFSLAFALPFVIFALFPSLLKNLPKSGGWLNSVKVVLGFVEVALGFKFLSTADQVYHWGLLDREVYLAIWIVCFTMLGFYLLGKLKFKYDSDLPYVSVFRLTLSIICFSFVVYMIPGMWGAPLKALSGYLPPIETQDFVINTEPGAQTGTQSSTKTVKYGDFLELPHNLSGYFDIKEAEDYARQVDKPLFIDFTGHGCVNCREMEARVWSDPRVLQILSNDYVICALYADDKIEVPREDWVTTDEGKVLKTLGKINSYFALREYGVNAQPYYVIQAPDGTRLAEPRGYNLDIEAFIAWLEQGLQAYRL